MKMTTWSMAVNVEQAVVGVTVDAPFFSAPHPGRSVAASSAAPAAAPIFNKSRREKPLEGMETHPACIGYIVSTKQRLLALAALVVVGVSTTGPQNRNALVANNMSQCG
jgi:hypothetical protein